ncbi:MAG: fimbria/pilus periplasmic chaperone [Alkalispirochaeta sp.]
MKHWYVTVVSMILFVTPAMWSMNVEPLSASFAPTGRDSIRTYRITNTQTEAIAVRIRTTSRELERNGDETRNPVEDEFLVFPGRLLLQPGQTQAVRVQWRGGAVTQEQAYRIIFEQVAVEDIDEDEGSGGGVTLSFMYRYVGAVYITPPDATGSVVLNSATGVGNPDRSGGVTEFRLLFENPGTKHTVVRDARIAIEGTTPDGRAYREEFDAESLPVLSGTNLLAGSRIEQTVQLSEAILPSTVEVTPNLTVSP